MELAYSIAQTGLHTSNFRQGVIANNLSNLTTDGFKAKMAEVANLWGPGAKAEAATPNFSIGAPKQTSASTDMYLDGPGFFRVALNGVEGYTRDGSFRVDSEGNLVNSSGHLLQPGITVPEDAIGVQVTRDGVVMAMTDLSEPPVELGQIDVTTFVNPGGLLEIGDNLYIEGANSGAPVTGTPAEQGFPSVHAFTLEESNVDAAEELTSLMRNQRSYQMNLRVFQTTDSIVGRAIDLFS